MGLLLAASMVIQHTDRIFPSEQHGAIKRLFFYGKQFEGCILANSVTTAMTDGEVWALLGPAPMRCSDLHHVTDVYLHYGIIVTYDLGRRFSVTDVSWSLCKYPNTKWMSDPPPAR